MPKKIKLTEKTIHVIVDRLRKFFKRNEYVAEQNFYKKIPMSSEKFDFFSSFHCIEKSNIWTVKSAETKVYPEKFFTGELLLCIESEAFEARTVYRVGDVFVFAPTRIKVRTNSPASVGKNTKKCTTILSPGSKEGFDETAERHEFDKKMCYEFCEEMYEDMMGEERFDGVGDLL